MLSHVDPTTLQQLQDFAIRVNQKRKKQAILEISSTELKFAALSYAIVWEKKMKSEHLELNWVKHLRM